MTREEIINMSAGRKLDRLIAEKVMGWEYNALGDAWIRKGEPWVGCNEFQPSTDIAAAWDVVEKIESMPDYWKTNIEHCPAASPFQKGREYTYIQFIFCWGDKEKGTQMKTGKYHGSSSLTLAICRAALFAVLDT